MHVTISYIIDTGNMESTSVSEPSLKLLFATSFYNHDVVVSKGSCYFYACLGLSPSFSSAPAASAVSLCLGCRSTYFSPI